MAACQAAVDSREFVDWVAFDSLEPIGSRVTPDLLALLISMQANAWKAKGDRPLLPQDVLPDPLAARRLSAAEEGDRVRQVAGDYRKLRAQRLAIVDGTDTEQVH